MEPTLPDLQALSQWDRQFCQFAEQQQLLKPKQLALALKIQRQQHGPLALILWQLGFVGLQHLAQLEIAGAPHCTRRVSAGRNARLQ